MKQDEIQRIQAKTPEQRFMRILIQEFNYAPKVAEAILVEAQESLLGQAQNLRPGQVRVILLKREAAHGQALSHSETVEVTWTVDAGAEDYQIEQSNGPSALRRSRIQRLLDEALSQGAVASQEDLARVLHVSVRTIQRDCAYLQQQGLSLPTRGKLKAGAKATKLKLSAAGWGAKPMTKLPAALITASVVSNGISKPLPG